MKQVGLAVRCLGTAAAAGCGGGTATEVLDAGPALDAGAVIDATDADAGPCAPAAGLAPVWPAPVVVVNDEVAELTLALPGVMTHEPVTIPSPGPRERAGVFEAGDVFGFWVSLEGTGAPVSGQAVDIDAAAAATLLTDATQIVFEPGYQVTTHDGFPAVVGRELRIYRESRTPVSHQRNLVLSSLLDRTIAELGLPLPEDDFEGEIVFVYSLVRRADSHNIVVGAFVERSIYLDRGRPAQSRARSVADGTALAAGGYGLRHSCEATSAVASSQVDVLVTRLGNDVCNVEPGYQCFYERSLPFAEAFYDALVAAEIDARITTGVEAPGTTHGPEDEPLCPDDSFLKVSAANRPTFIDCFEADANVYPVRAARWMVERALPRADDAQHIRPGAQLLVVVQEAPPIWSEPDAPTPGTMADYDPFAVEYAASFSELGALVHTIGHQGDPSPPCFDWYLGLSEVTERTGGRSHDQCYADPETVADTIVQSALAANAIYPLDAQPVSASLAVTAPVGILEPVPHDGFEYLGVTENSLRAAGQPMVAGESVTIGVAAMRWELVE